MDIFSKYSSSPYYASGSATNSVFGLGHRSTCQGLMERLVWVLLPAAAVDTWTFAMSPGCCCFCVPTADLEQWRWHGNQGGWGTSSAQMVFRSCSSGHSSLNWLSIVNLCAPCHRGRFSRCQDRKETDKLDSLFPSVENTLCCKQMNCLSSQIALELIHRLISVPSISVLVGHVVYEVAKIRVSVTRWWACLLSKYLIECISMAQKLLRDDWSND